MKTITIYERGDEITIQFRGKKSRVRVVSKWAPGEGDGYAVAPLSAPDHECFDVKAKYIVK